MSKVNLLMNFIGRSVNWGFMIGGILGVIYYLLVFQFTISIYLFYSLLFGSLVGILLGGVNGMISGFLTIVLVPSNIGERKYRFTILIIILATTFISSALIFHSALSFYAVMPSSNDTTVLSLSAAIIAAIAAGYASQAVLGWYLEQHEIVDEDTTAL